MIAAPRIARESAGEASGLICYEGDGGPWWSTVAMAFQLAVVAIRLLAEHAWELLAAGRTVVSFA